jgi:hypothetical protein
MKTEMYGEKEESRTEKLRMATTIFQSEFIFSSRSLLCKLFAGWFEK